MTDHTSMETQMRASNVSGSLFDMEENFLNGNLEEDCEKIEEYIYSSLKCFFNSSLPKIPVILLIAPPL